MHNNIATRTTTSLLLFVFIFICVTSSDPINLLQNPGFDESQTDCNTLPSWTQVNTSNLFTTCNGEAWWIVSPPNALYMMGSNGWCGAQQTVELNQQTPSTLNFSVSVWLVSCSQQTCYTTIGWFGVKYQIVFQDSTTDVYEIPFPYQYSTVVFVEYSDIYTPPKAIKSLTLQILLDGNGEATAMWDNLLLTQATSDNATPTAAPTSAPTTEPTSAPSSPTVAPTDAPTTPTDTPTDAPTTPTDAPTTPTDAATTVPTPPTPTPTNGNEALSPTHTSAATTTELFSTTFVVASLSLAITSFL